MRGTWVGFLDWEDPLEKGKTTYSSILAWRISWTYGPWSRKESDTTERLSRLIKVASFPEVVILWILNVYFPFILKMKFILKGQLGYPYFLVLWEDGIVAFMYLQNCPE